MEQLGETLSRLGPVFGVLLYVLLVGTMIAMLAVSLPVLVRRRRARHA
jgi:hypothetical protein